MKNILIYSEKLIDMSPDAHCLEEAIAVFATPPNSYTAVTDPIDLVISPTRQILRLDLKLVVFDNRFVAEVAIYPCWKF